MIIQYKLFTTYPKYHIEKRKITCTTAELQTALAGLLEHYPNAYVHPVRDGSKLYLNSQLECPWIHLRSSNTEPIVRVIAESDNPDEAARLCDEVEGLFPNA